MTMRGLVLITVFLANVLATQAECCKCDCRQSGTYQSQLYYLPIVPPHIPAAGHGIYQSLSQVAVPNADHYAQAVYGAGYQTAGAAAQYNIVGKGVENSLDTDVKLRGNVAAEEGQKALERSSFEYSSQGSLDSNAAISTDHLRRQEISKVSTHQGNQYINIEKQVSPHESSSHENANSLEHEKDHHHGKNDYYKFEYAVNDQHTHDIKSHKEEKRGDAVQGEYSLVEDGGNVRTVKYYADWKTGFHAQVHNSKTAALG